MSMVDIWKIAHQKKIAAIDIDGVLAKYPDFWVEYINKELRANYSDLAEAKNSISFAKYKQLKIAYREGGMEAVVPVVEGAAEFTKRLKDRGYTIVLLTARPYEMHRNIFADTKKWLDNNKILYDGIIWDSNKHWLIIKEMPYLSFMVEDNSEIANMIADYGYSVFLLDNKYNQQALHKNVKRVMKLEEIWF